MNQARLADPRHLHVHALSHLVPDMRQDEWEDFYADIALSGIRVPLEVLADGTTVVDGRHRLRAAVELGLNQVPVVDAPLNGDQPEVYMLKAAVLRRHLTDDQRAAMAVLWREENKKQGERTDLKPTSAGRPAEVSDASPTRAQAVQEFKVSRWKVDKAAQLSHTSPSHFEKVHRGEETLRDAKRALEKEARQQLREQAAQADAPDIGPLYQVCRGDFREVCQGFNPSSIDAIITDPPYAEADLPLYSALAQVAARLLKPGGSLLVIVGCRYLPEVLDSLRGHLGYQWVIAFVMGTGTSRFWDRKVCQAWKPVLWFVKGRYDGDWVTDLIRSPAPEKEYHTWQQPEAGLAALVERFSQPGDCILDPMMGTGTTGVAAVRLGRRFIGIDMADEAVAIARHRLAEATTVKEGT